MVVLGERIKELRQRNGRTQDSLAGELGVTAQAVSMAWRHADYGRSLTEKRWADRL